MRMGRGEVTKTKKLIYSPVSKEATSVLDHTKFCMSVFWGKE